jgi:serine/threonine protein kinase
MTPRVVGRYEIVRLLGRGGMASVHLARQPALDREVALKELHSAHVADAAFAARFLQESRVAGALNHPSVVSVIEYLEHDGAPFIAMEYLERGSLRPLVGRLSLAQVAGVMESVLDGLAEAAAQGVVHRDLKPENVLVTADGHAKVADFGVAKAIGQATMSDFRTATGQIVGTPAYMAPEQAGGEEITPQADLYATGLMAYELFTGRHPFHGTDAPMALLMKQLTEEPAPLAQLRPDLPPGIVAWVHAMLSKAPAARPAGAVHAWDRLEGVVADELGPKWRRAAAICEETRPETATEPEPSASGIFSVVVHPEPPPTIPSHPILAATPDATTAPLAAPSETALPAAAEPPLPPTSDSDPVPGWAEPPPRRRRALLAVLAAALVLAVAGILGVAAPGEEPQAAPAPKGPSGAERVRDVVAPAIRANARVSNALSSLDPGDEPDRALDRVDAALPATESAFAAARDLPDARRALRTQRQYLEVVRSTLRVESDGARLGELSSRLATRLDALVPDGSESVHGAHRLRVWVAAEQAVVVPPAPTATPAATVFAPAPSATPTVVAGPTPAAAGEPVAAQPRRPLRQRLKRLVRRTARAQQ